MGAEARSARGAVPALPPIRKVGGLFLQSCGVAFMHPDPRQGLVQVMSAEAPKFGALRARAQSGASHIDMQFHSSPGAAHSATSSDHAT